MEWPKSVVSCHIPVGEPGGDYFWCVGQPFGLRKTSYLVNGSLLILKGRGKKKYLFIRDITMMTVSHLEICLPM